MTAVNPVFRTKLLEVVSEKLVREPVTTLKNPAVAEVTKNVRVNNLTLFPEIFEEGVLQVIESCIVDANGVCCVVGETWTLLKGLLKLDKCGVSTVAFMFMTKANPPNEVVPVFA